MRKSIKNPDLRISATRSVYELFRKKRAAFLQPDLRRNATRCFFSIAAASARAGGLCARAVCLCRRERPGDVRFSYPDKPVSKEVFRRRASGHLCDGCPRRCDLIGKIWRLSAGDHPQFASIRRTPPAGVFQIRRVPPVRLKTGGVDMTFNDIFKSSFLENVSEGSMLTVKGHISANSYTKDGRIFYSNSMIIDRADYVPTY